MKVNDFIYKYQNIKNANANIMLVDNLIDNFTIKYYKPNKVINSLIDNNFVIEIPKKNNNKYNDSKYIEREDIRINKLIVNILNKYFNETCKDMNITYDKDGIYYDYNKYNKKIFKEEFEKLYITVVKYLKKKKELYFDIINLHLKNTAELLRALFEQDSSIKNIDEITLYTFDFSFNSFARNCFIHEPLILRIIPNWITSIKESPSIQILIIQLRKIIKNHIRYPKYIYNNKVNNRSLMTPKREYECISKRLPLFLSNYMAVLPMAIIRKEDIQYLLLYSNLYINYIFNENKDIVITSYKYCKSPNNLTYVTFEGSIERFLTELSYYYSNIKDHEILKLKKFYSYNFNTNNINMFLKDFNCL